MYCKHCGEKISDDSSFCKYCGENIEETDLTSTAEVSDEIQTEVHGNSEVTIADRQIEFERYAGNMVKRRIVGTIFRILFWLSGLVFLFLGCFASYYMGEIFFMILKIILFPFTIVIWPIISMLSGELPGGFFWLWFFMMGSYSISTFYGKLRPVV